MPRTRALNASIPVTLDGTGAGTAQLGPQHAGERWEVAAAAVGCATNVAEATCTVYQGGAPGSGLVGATTWGSTGDSTSNFGAPLFPGQYVFAVWTGGDPGTRATLTLTGTKYVP